MTGGLLQSKVIIVTGAARGVGLATVALMVQEGACVVAVDVDGLTLEKTSRQLSPKKGCYLELVIDVGAKGSAQQIAHRTIEEFGAVDGLVNAAAVQTPGGNVLEASDSDWDRYLDVNLRSVVRLCRVAIPHDPTRRRDHREHRLHLQHRGNSPAGRLRRLESRTLAADPVGHGRLRATGHPGKLRLSRPNPDLGVLAGRSVSEALADPALHALAAAHPDGTLASTQDIAEAAVFLSGPVSPRLRGRPGRRRRHYGQRGHAVVLRNEPMNLSPASQCANALTAARECYPRR